MAFPALQFCRAPVIENAFNVHSMMPLANVLGHIIVAGGDTISIAEKGML
jgi:hypothetical protein